MHMNVDFFSGHREMFPTGLYTERSQNQKSNIHMVNCVVFVVTLDLEIDQQNSSLISLFQMEELLPPQQKTCFSSQAQIFDIFKVGGHQIRIIQNNTWSNDTLLITDWIKEYCWSYDQK